VKPLLITDEPLCQDGFLACGDGNCIERGLFCNGEKDCGDGSDENSCGKCFAKFTNKNKKQVTRKRKIKKNV
jgi:Low-density lipoprotein receptor domain class A